MMWHWSGYGWLGGLSMMFFWIAVAWLIVWTVRSMSPNLGRRDEGALDILEQRFARGDIDATELAERRRELMSTREAGPLSREGGF